MRVIHNKEYISFFNEETGAYVRTGLLKDGMDTGEDPFMAGFPELLDVGIMGHCAHGQSGLCVQAGVECYQNGLTAQGTNMLLADFKRIAAECRGRTFQIALGGCGDPDQHEDFEGILLSCRDNDIVPNFTTSGLGLSEEKARLCKRYCGAVAVSWYRSGYTLAAIDRLLAQGVKTNIHYVLNKDTVTEALVRLQAGNGAEGFPKGINAVIFLLHKPVGQGSREKMLSGEEEAFRRLLTFVDTGRMPFKVGFDSCTVPALLQLSHTDFSCMDTCEGARWSAYISADLDMMPCSFAHKRGEWKVSLREMSIQEAWNSPAFEAFRVRFRETCPACPKRTLCMGGCPVVPEIVLCGENYREIKGGAGENG